MTIHNEILLLKDSIDAMQIKMSNYNDKLETVEEQVGILLQDTEQDKQDQEEKFNNLNKAHDAAKGQAVSSMAGPSSAMSGLSQEETHAALNEHMGKTVKSGDASSFAENAQQPSSDDVENHNRKLAAMHDSQSAESRESSGLDAKRTANSYINANKASCTCPAVVSEEHPGIEDAIINKANEYGFGGSHGCSPDKACAQKLAKQKLRSLATMYGCEAVNPDGQYPYQASQMNKHSKGDRPKNYDFPQ